MTEHDMAEREWTSPEQTGPPPLPPDLERRVFWRVIPLLFAIAYTSQLDRTNLAFAALQLDADLGFSRTVHGLGSGTPRLLSLFFIGYLAQLPANVACLTFGVRRWLSCILLVWAVVAGLGAAIRTRAHFLVLRFLLGLAEAGTFPAIYFQLARFYDADGLGLAYTWVATATAVAGLTGAPLAAGLLALDGRGGLRGWQWLFLLEAVPACLLSVAVALALPSPADAGWLSAGERSALRTRVRWAQAGQGALELVPREAAVAGAGAHDAEAPASEDRADELPLLASDGGPRRGSAPVKTQGNEVGGVGDENGSRAGTAAALRAALRDVRLWWLGGILLLVDAAMNAVNFWLPQIIRASLRAGIVNGDEGGEAGAEATSRQQRLDVKASLLAGLPFAVAGVGMVLNAQHAQRRHERRLHTAVPLVAAAGALGLLPLTALLLGTAGTVAALTAGAAGIWAVHGPFYSWPSAFLDAQTASLGFALVKSLGALGGFCGPLVVGVLADAEGGDFAGGAFFLAAVALLGAGMTLGERGCRDCP
ncbi:Putative tartrate transporter [Auxenochlorella protothecoides]|uniref:Putative tartrate transporter n=1 Tax=Auxenochlorella protothecoides TaxID=3075 RepID=A0A087SL75_AUXPR|nr:Putative tartrate transporter [Auxenochlorella protothecoides]KFM26479.1 Putative tartrate transporter [Auxenochlorella protothecoides]